jgi:hypothetical protein
MLRTRLALLVFSVGCGGAAGAPSPAPDPSDPRLDARLELPGTGVSLRPVRGARLAPTGASLVSADGALVTIVSIGAELDVTSTLPPAAGPVTEHAARDGTRDTRTGRYVETSHGVPLERSYFFARAQSGRALLVTVAYPEALALEVGGAVRASLASVRWRDDAALDPAAALGIGLGDIEGLRVVTDGVGVVGLTPSGAAFPPAAHEPFLAVVPTPLGAPDADACMSVAASLAHTDLRALALASPVASSPDGLSGCEVVGGESTTGGLRYAAVLSRAPIALVLLGGTGTDVTGPWIDRFRGAARSVRLVR